jgi:hypothetical protein
VVHGQALADKSRLFPDITIHPDTQLLFRRVIVSILNTGAWDNLPAFFFASSLPKIDNDEFLLTQTSCGLWFTAKAAAGAPAK